MYGVSDWYFTIRTPKNGVYALKLRTAALLVVDAHSAKETSTMMELTTEMQQWDSLCNAVAKSDHAERYPLNYRLKDGEARARGG